MVTDKSGLLNKRSGVVSKRMSKGLRIIKSTECNLKSEQTQNSLRAQYRMGRMPHNLDKRRDARRIVFPASDLKHCLINGWATWPRESPALFAFDRRPVLGEV